MNKKNYTKARGVYTLMLLLFISHLFLGNRTAPPLGRTGAPGEGACTDCHGGNNSQGLDGSLQITGLPAEVMPSTTYRVTVEVANPNGLSSYAGMQMVALTSADENAGSFDNASTGARVNVASNSGRNYLDHNPALVYDASGVATFSVDWTSPADPDPTVTFYAVGNIANGNGGTSNDLILFETQTTEVVGEVVTDLPDLTASNVDGFIGTYLPDEIVEFTWDLNNLGTAVAVNEYRVGMYLSSDSEFSADDELVGEVPTGNTFPGTITGVPGAIRVPVDAPDGEYYLHLVVDVDNTVDESDEDNNVFTATSLISVLLFEAEPIILDLYSFLDCEGGLIGVSAFGGEGSYTYMWNTGEVLNEFVIQESGTYTVTVTDEGGNVEVGVIEVEVPSLLTVEILVDQLPGCGSVGSATAVVTGGTQPFSYIWSDGSGTETNSTLEAGEQSIVIVDYNGCFASTSIILNDTGDLDIEGTVEQLVCPGAMDASISILASGGGGSYTYTWSNAATTPTISNLSSGTYMVTVESDESCTAVSSFTVTAINPIEFIHEIQNESCGAMDGSVSVLTTGGTGPYSYLWSNGAQTNGIENLAMGTYTVTVTDINNCESEESYVIEGSDDVALVTTVVNLSCAAIADGAIEVTSVVGGVGPYTYSWSIGEATSTIANLEAGVYTVTVTDTNTNCTTEASYTVSEPAAIQMDVDVLNVSCFGEPSGSITILNVEGGSPPYVFSWSDGTLTSTLNGLVAGLYTITVSDANGCTLSQAITVTEPEELVATASVQLEANGGLIQLAVTGGTTPYTYLWSNGATTPNNGDLADGVYTVEVTDGAGCTYSESFQIVSTSTETISELSSWEIYPTPAEDFIMIDASFDNAVSLSMRILSLDGRYLETLVQDLNFSASQQKKRIDISHLDQGIYLFLLESDQGRAVKRFVKM